MSLLELQRLTVRSECQGLPHPHPLALPEALLIVAVDPAPQDALRRSNSHAVVTDTGNTTAADLWVGVCNPAEDMRHLRFEHNEARVVAQPRRLYSHDVVTCGRLLRPVLGGLLSTETGTWLLIAQICHWKLRTLMEATTSLRLSPQT